MQTCENCKVEFKPAAQSGSTEVTSARILCPKCAEERRRQKEAARQSQAGQSRPAPNPQSRPAAPARPAQAEVRSAPRVAERPAPTRSARGSGEVPRAERAHRAQPGQDAARKAAKIGGIIAGVIVIAAIGMMVYVRGQNETVADLTATYQAKLNNFMAQANALDLSTAEDSQKLTDMVEADAETARDPSISPAVAQLEAKARATLAAAKERAEMMKGLEDVEQKLQKGTDLTAEDLIALRQRVANMKPMMQAAGKGAMERWEVANKQSVISLAERLSLEATNFATMRPGEGIAALERFKKAEDEILKMIGKLEKGDTASKDKLVGIYSNVIRESDAIVAKTFTPEVIAAAPVRNLLSLDRKEWNATEEVSGFSFRIANGQLVVIGPDKGRAIMSIGDKEQWRDYVIEAELELASGNVQACLRLGATADNFTPTLFLDERAAPPNKTVKLIASVIGSKLNARAGDMEASFEFHVEDLKPANSRVGSFGLVVPPGCQLRFTKLGVKVLR